MIALEKKRDLAGFISDVLQFDGHETSILADNQITRHKIVS